MRLLNAIPNRRAIAMLDIAETDDVLELGFGPGHALRALAKRAIRGSVTGIDQSATMLAAARAHNRRAITEGQMRLLHGSFERIPLPSASIDKVLAVNIAYFISPLGHSLNEARRVLRPGGLMSLYVTDYSAMRWAQFAGPETYQMFDAAGLRAFLLASAFAEDRVVIHRIRLPLGFRGLVAAIRKA